MIDPLYVTKGTKVSLSRGARCDSSNGPIDGGPAQVQAEDKGRKLWEPDADEQGRPVPTLIDNPKPAPAGVIFGRVDGRQMAPVKWPDGSWASVRLQDLELVEASPEAKASDPVVQRSEELRAVGENAAGLEARIVALEERCKSLQAALEAFIASGTAPILAKPPAKPKAPAKAKAAAKA